MHISVCGVIYMAWMEIPSQYLLPYTPLLVYLRHTKKECGGYYPQTSCRPPMLVTQHASVRKRMHRTMLSSQTGPCSSVYISTHVYILHHIFGRPWGSPYVQSVWDLVGGVGPWSLCLHCGDVSECSTYPRRKFRLVFHLQRHQNQHQMHPPGTSSVIFRLNL